MGLMECASCASLWKGYDYAKSDKVKKVNKLNEEEFETVVEGSGSNIYNIKLNINHPKKCSCDCPYANGKKIICKHIIASYFTVFPDKADDYYISNLKGIIDENEKQEEKYNSLDSFVSSMPREDLEMALLSILETGPEWQLDHFLAQHDLENLLDDEDLDE